MLLFPSVRCVGLLWTASDIKGVATWQTRLITRYTAHVPVELLERSLILLIDEAWLLSLRWEKKNGPYVEPMAGENKTVEPMAGENKGRM